MNLKDIAIRALKTALQAGLAAALAVGFEDPKTALTAGLAAAASALHNLILNGYRTQRGRRADGGSEHEVYLD